jgi:hypothetical protein
MAWQGGVVPTAAITQSVTQLATQTASTGVPQLLGQVWQGAGQSFFGSAGQALAGGLAGSAVNIALNSDLGTNVVGPQGFSLDSGRNILASTITPYVTSSVAAGINQQIGQSLKGAGAFGPILNNLGTQAVNQVFNGITNSIFGAANPGAGGDNATNYKMFPGAGGDGIAEPKAEYGDRSYNLTDIVFSLRRANVGPQQDGDAQAVNDPKTATTIPATTATSSEGAAAASTPTGVNALKQQAMGETYNFETTNRDVLLRQANENGYNSLNKKQLELLGNTGDIKIISNGSSGLLYYTRAEWESRFQGASSAPLRDRPLF